MRLNNYLISEGFVDGIFKSLIKKPANTAMKEIKKGFMDFIDLLDRIDDTEKNKILNLINRSMGTNYRSVDQIKKMSSSRISESFELNEDFKHWWEIIKDQGWFNITFYPALQVWFEVASLVQNFLKGEALDQTTIKKAVFFGILWLVLTSAKFAKDFYKWKKENPEEYSKERGKPVPMSKRDIARFT